MCFDPQPVRTPPGMATVWEATFVAYEKRRQMAQTVYLLLLGHQTGHQKRRSRQKSEAFLFRRLPR